MERIALGLNGNSTLKAINLSKVKMSESMFQRLISSVAHNKSLKLVRLRTCDLKQEYAKHLPTMFYYNKTIEEIDVVGNDIINISNYKEIAQ